MKNKIAVLYWIVYSSVLKTAYLNDCSEDTKGNIILFGEVRPNYTTGWVSICDGEEWRAVCGSGWDMNDTRVLCRELGFPPNGGVNFCRDSCNGGSHSYRGAINFECSGNETSLFKCDYEKVLDGWFLGFWTFGDCNRLAGVLCSITPSEAPPLPTATTPPPEMTSTPPPEITTTVTSSSTETNITSADATNNQTDSSSSSSSSNCSVRDTGLAVLGALAAILLLALVGVVMGWAWSHHKNKKEIMKLRQGESHENIYTYAQTPSSALPSVHYSTLGAQDTPTTGEGEGVYHHLEEQDGRSRVPILRKNKGRHEGAVDTVYSALQHN